MNILETERLILRRYKAEDWKDLYEHLSLEEVVKFEPYDVFSEEQCKQEAKARSTLESFWAVCLKSNKKLIGNIYFGQVEPKEILTWDLGYTFNPLYYNKGYATESCRKILEYGFNKLNMRRVFAECDPKNIASWKVLEKLNIRREGHLIKDKYFDLDKVGNPIWKDTYLYAILKEEWLRNQK